MMQKDRDCHSALVAEARLELKTCPSGPPPSKKERKKERKRGNPPTYVICFTH